nr:3-oxoacyl-[acyl-carrier-protein] synthase 2-like [Nerophis lumbriciformis]
MSGSAANSAPRRVVVTGVGLLSAVGDSPAALWTAQREGRSGLAPVEMFDTAALGTSIGAEIRDFAPLEYLGKVNLRPLDRTGRLTVVAAHLALEASGWSTEARAEKEVGLVLGTMFGSVHTISEFDIRAQTAGPNYAKPLVFANTVINAAAGQAAIWHGLRGVNSTFAGGTTAGLQAIAQGADLIRTGRADVLLAGGAEELCFESFCGFDQAGLLAAPVNGNAACAVPFAARRNGFAAGEGAALLMLEEASVAKRRGATILAEIRGHASCYDCSRGEQADSASAALQYAVTTALADAGVEPAQIDAVSSSANGSPKGDLNEANGLVAAFGEHATELSVMAVKSILGETFGAAGAFQAVALLGAMRDRYVPVVAGLEECLDSWPLAPLRSTAQPADLRLGLVDTLGLDGNVAALVLERGADLKAAESLFVESSDGGS